MDVRSLFDTLVAAGKQAAGQAAAQATDFATKNLGLPTDPAKQKETLNTLGAGAALGGLATVLLGTKTGRKISGKLVTVGSLAAAGALAYTTYQNWAKANGKATDAATDAPMAQLSGPASETRSLNILRAMIAAANADGVIDQQEHTVIDAEMKRLQLPEESVQWLRDELRSPKSAVQIAALADSPAAAAELYAVSSMIVDYQNLAEEAYMKELHTALKLEPSLVDLIKKQFS